MIACSPRRRTLLLVDQNYALEADESLRTVLIQSIRYRKTHSLERSDHRGPDRARRSLWSSFPASVTQQRQ